MPDMRQLHVVELYKIIDLCDFPPDINGEKSP